MLIIMIIHANFKLIVLLK